LDITSTIGAQWLDECVKAHASCSTRAPYIPTRLIDVGPPDGSAEPVLVETTKQPQHDSSLLIPPNDRTNFGRYVTLSHCWGDTDHLTTTSTTIEDRKRSIPFSSLNQTFKDAVLVTRTLGERMLWIDSLCITQDSVTDWEEESAKMGLIYASSVLNIAADAADDGDQGFLLNREPIEMPCNIVQPDGAQTAGQVWFRPLKVERFVAYSGNLRRRGWVLQEYILSPRTLRYGLYGLTWECRQVSKYRDDVIFEENKPRGAARDLKNVALLERSANSDSLSLSNVINVWHKLVEEYSKKELTRETDRLPAISGLAAHVQAARNLGKYFAGIWEFDLPGGLLWTTEDARWRNPTYLAPSWSWASSHKNCWVIYISNSLPFQVKVLDVKVKSLGENPLGRVSDGHLILEGLLQKATVSSDDSDPLSIEIYMGPAQTLIFRCPREYIVHDEKVSEIWFLLLAGPIPEPEDLRGPSRLRSALVLEEVDSEKAVFRRISLRTGGWSTDYDWIGAKRRVITIV
jgi:hypothetical protein